MSKNIDNECTPAKDELQPETLYDSMAAYQYLTRTPLNGCDDHSSLVSYLSLLSEHDKIKEDKETKG